MSKFHFYTFRQVEYIRFIQKQVHHIRALFSNSNFKTFNKLSVSHQWCHSEVNSHRMCLPEKHKDNDAVRRMLWRQPFLLKVKQQIQDITSYISSARFELLLGVELSNNGRKSWLGPNRPHQDIVRFWGGFLCVRSLTLSANTGLYLIISSKLVQHSFPLC